MSTGHCMHARLLHTRAVPQTRGTFPQTIMLEVIAPCKTVP